MQPMAPPPQQQVQPARNAPSGTWRGYYSYEGVNRSLCEFALEFVGDNAVTGGGVDDVGAYSITGHRFGDQVNFTKTYQRGSRNDCGILNEDNEGHSVQYRGAFCGRDLGAGFRGTWTLRNTGTNSDGIFHLWPAMENLSVLTGMLSERPPSVEAHPAFEVSDNGECTVCFDLPISTCLVPCGHIALCSKCAQKLGVGGSCPICRASIQAVVQHRADPLEPMPPPHAAQALRGVV